MNDYGDTMPPEVADRVVRFLIEREPSDGEALETQAAS